MNIKLLDYLGKETIVSIPYDTKEVTIKLISGDMMMVKPFKKDTGINRVIDFYDGQVTIKKENFNKLNELKDSYKIFEI